MVTFTVPENPRIYIYGIIGLAVVFCFLFYHLFFTVLQKLLTHDRKFWSYLKYFLGYFAFMGIFWLLTWPGIFKGDEFYVIQSAKDFTLSGGQSGLTSVFYIVSLLFFPSMATITFVLLLIVCTIFAVIMHDMAEIIRGKRRILLYLPFVLFPVIDGNLFTLRATLVSWIFLFIICKLYYLVQTDKLTMRYAWLLAILSGLLIAWRSEYIYMILLLPFTLWFLKKINWKRALLLCLVCFISYSLFQIPNNLYVVYAFFGCSYAHKRTYFGYGYKKIDASGWKNA